MLAGAGPGIPGMGSTGACGPLVAGGSDPGAIAGSVAKEVSAVRLRSWRRLRAGRERSQRAREGGGEV